MGCRPGYGNLSNRIPTESCLPEGTSGRGTDEVNTAVLERLRMLPLPEVSTATSLGKSVGMRFRQWLGDVYEWDEKSTHPAAPYISKILECRWYRGGRHWGARSWRFLRFGDYGSHFARRFDSVNSGGSLPAGECAEPVDFNSYGSRRGNDRTMTRGTFANVRIKNLMVPGVEGGVTKAPALANR